MRLRGYPSRQPSDAHLAVLDIDGLHQRVELLRVKVVRALPFPAELVGYLAQQLLFPDKVVPAAVALRPLLSLAAVPHLVVDRLALS